jgi:hypothetical protein
MRASCYYEIARVHAAEGSAEVALRFLERALPYALKAERLKAEGNLNVHSVAKKILQLRASLETASS